MKSFKLEEYLTQHEFTCPYLLCCSDAESFSMSEILALANEQEKKLWNDLSLGYTQPHGLPELRTQIATSIYSNLKADNILCFAGAEEGIFAALYTICDKDDHIIVLTPAYQSLLEVPLSRGSKVTEINLLAENDWRIDLEAIKSTICSTTKLIIINFPHNPTGQVISQQELDELINLCQQHDLWLFSDEVYRLLGEPDQGWSNPAACDYHKAISLGVMSKAFGMAGLRIGWIATKDKNLLNSIKQTKDYLSICNSSPAEIISLIALRNSQRLLARNNQIIRNNIQLIREFLTEYSPLFSWCEPQGGCVGFIYYHGKQEIDNFCHHIVQQSGVLLLPATVYNYAKPYFRIGFGRKNMPESLNEFKKYLIKYNYE